VAASPTPEPLPAVPKPEEGCSVDSLPPANYPDLPERATPTAVEEFARGFERAYGATAIDGSISGTDGIRTVVEQETPAGALVWVEVRFDYTTKGDGQTVYGSANSSGWYYVTAAFAVRADGDEQQVPGGGWRTVACQ
jgi:hypothetical protein